VLAPRLRDADSEPAAGRLDLRHGQGVLSSSSAINRPAGALDNRFDGLMPRDCRCFHRDGARWLALPSARIRFNVPRRRRGWTCLLR
jgi:hypothetical protein